MKKWLFVIICCYTHKKEINSILYLWHFFEEVRKLKFTFIDLEKQTKNYTTQSPHSLLFEMLKSLLRERKKKRKKRGFLCF